MRYYLTPKQYGDVEATPSIWPKHLYQMVKDSQLVFSATDYKPDPTSCYLVAAETTPAQQTTLEGISEVISFPDDLTGVVKPADRTKVRAFFDTYGVPQAVLVNGMTWEQLVASITDEFTAEQATQGGNRAWVRGRPIQFAGREWKHGVTDPSV